MHGKVLLLAILGTARLGVADVTVSFLQEDVALSNTLAVLRRADISPASLAVFDRTVQKHNLTGIGLSLARFPAMDTDGFYRFASCADIVSALPRSMSRAQHDAGLVCLDLVTLLLRESDCSCYVPESDAPVAGYTVPQVFNEGGSPMPQGPFALDRAFDTMRPGYYTDAMQHALGLSWNREQKALTVCLAEYDRIPGSASRTSDDLAQQLLRARISQWRARQLVFPTNASVIQFHVADLSKGYTSMYHCGLLVPKEPDGYMYVEKVDSRGPFVRIDLADPAELLHLSALYFSPSLGRSEIVVFATANETLLGTVSPSEAFDDRNVTGHEMWRLSGLNSWENPVTMHSPDLLLDALERDRATTNHMGD